MSAGVIYTPLPPEMVLEGIDNQSLVYREIEVGGAKLLVEDQGTEKCKVVRLISTNPMDYLNKAFQPGTEMMLKPEMIP